MKNEVKTPVFIEKLIHSSSQIQKPIPLILK